MIDLVGLRFDLIVVVVGTFLAALWALAWLGGIPPLRVADAAVAFTGLQVVCNGSGVCWYLRESKLR